MAKKDKDQKKPDKAAPASKSEMDIAAIVQAVKNSDFIKGVGGDVMVATNDPASERIKTGCKELDEVLCGGLVRGRIYEFYGEESGGKTTACLTLAAEYQKDNASKKDKGVVAVIDSEHSLDTKYAEVLGVDLSRLLVMRPKGGEQSLNVMKMLIEKGIKLIILDSVAALTTKNERDGDIGDTHVGEQARMMSGALKTLVEIIACNGSTVVFTNQTRSKIGVMFGNPETTTGGAALKFYCSARVRFNKSGTIKEKVGDDEIEVSNEVTAKVVKSKIGIPYRKAKFHITYGVGIDKAFSLMNRAFKAGVIVQKGAWISFNDQNLANGKKACVELFRNDIMVACQVEEAILSSGVKIPVVEVEDGVKEDGDDDNDEATLDV